jgi:hypothetical protein
MKRMEMHLMTKGGRYTDDHATRSRLAGAEAATGAKGSVAFSQYAKIVRDTPGLSAEEQDRRIVAALTTEPSHSYLCGFLVRDSSDGSFFCTLCKKNGTEAHLSSAMHLMRAEQHGLADLLGGTSTTARRFTSSTGYVGPLTKIGIMSFWGDEIQNLVARSLDILRQKQAFWVNSRYPITLVDVRQARLALVQYTGTGKYSLQNGLAYFDEVIDHPSMIEAMSKEGVKVDDLTTESDETKGWWPVVAFTLDKATRERCRIWDEPDVDPVPVSCFYQLLSDRVDVWTVPVPKKG